MNTYTTPARRTLRILTPRERELIAPELRALADTMAREAALREVLGRTVALLAGQQGATLDAETGEIFVVEAVVPGWDGVTPAPAVDVFQEIREQLGVVRAADVRLDALRGQQPGGDIEIPEHVLDEGGPT